MRTADTDFSCPFLILQNITMMERNVSHMKVLLINGSPHEKGCTYTALHEMEKVFRESGVETELVSVGTNPIRGCIACGGCRKKGACVFSDLVNEIAPKFEACDGLVVGSPVYYASANATLVALLDRLFYSTPFDKTMKVGAAVASARRGGLTATFDELNKYFTISGMAVLERHPRQPCRRGTAGRRGLADDADTGTEHDLFDALHRTGQGKIRSAGERATHRNKLHPIRIPRKSQ